MNILKAYENETIVKTLNNNTIIATRYNEMTSLSIDRVKQLATYPKDMPLLECIVNYVRINDL